jgi:hypothetical protein
MQLLLWIGEMEMTREIVTLLLALGFLTVLSLAAALPSVAAPAAFDPVVAEAAVSSQVLQVRSRRHHRWHGRHAYRSGRNHYDCLGGEDSSGVRC